MLADMNSIPSISLQKVLIFKLVGLYKVVMLKPRGLCWSIMARSWMPSFIGQVSGSSLSLAVARPIAPM